MQPTHSVADDPSSAALADLVPVVRDSLGLDGTLPDDAVLASLRMIAAPTDPHERWRAAFQSSLGHWLGLKAGDLNAALNTLVGLLPSRPLEVGDASDGSNPSCI